MRHPRYSIATLLWLTTIVAAAAALPPTKIRSYIVIENGPPVLYEEQDAPLWVQWTVRGVVAVVLLLIVWAGHIVVRTIAKRRAALNRNSQLR